MRNPTPARSARSRATTVATMALTGGIVLGMIGTVPAMAAGGTTRWVDPAAATTAPGSACGTSAGYVTVAAAVAAADDGDTVRVCAGDYPEGTITVRTPNLTFEGAHAGVSAGVGGARSGDPSPAESTISGTLSFAVPFATIDGFSFTSTGDAIYGTGAADGGTVVNNRFVGVSGKSISTYGDFAAVTHNLFADSGWGVHHDDKNTAGGLVASNVFRGNSYSVSSAARDLAIRDNVMTGIRQRAITLYGSGNTVAGNTIDMPVTPAAEGAITLSGSVTDAEITGNTITGAGSSIWVSGGAQDVTVEHNLLLGIGKLVTRSAAPTLAVGPNWWGSTTGPFVSGSLDAARVSNVTVSSWCAEAACSNVLTEAPAPAPAPPAADSAALDALDLPDSSADFSGTDLNGIDASAPLDGEMDWGSADTWVDLYAYSSPVYLGTFPVVGGKVVLTGVDLSALAAGGHRLVFVGQTSGSIKVAAFRVAATGLAATGATSVIALTGTAAVLTLLGAALIARRTRLLAR